MSKLLNCTIQTKLLSSVLDSDFNPNSSPFIKVHPNLSEGCLDILEKKKTGSYFNIESGIDQGINGGKIRVCVKDKHNTPTFLHHKNDAELLDFFTKDTSDIFGIKVEYHFCNLFVSCDLEDNIELAVKRVSVLFYKIFEKMLEELRKDLEKHSSNIKHSSGDSLSASHSRKAIACIKHIRTITGAGRFAKLCSSIDTYAKLNTVPYFTPYELAANNLCWNEMKALVRLINFVTLIPYMEVTIFVKK